MRYAGGWLKVAWLRKAWNLRPWGFSSDVSVARFMIRLCLASLPRFVLHDTSLQLASLSVTSLPCLLAPLSVESQFGWELSLPTRVWSFTLIVSVTCCELRLCLCLGNLRWETPRSQYLAISCLPMNGLSWIGTCSFLFISLRHCWAVDPADAAEASTQVAESVQQMVARTQPGTSECQGSDTSRGIEGTDDHADHSLDSSGDSSSAWTPVRLMMSLSCLSPTMEITKHTHT